MKQHTKYWPVLCDILEKQFPKGESKERGRTLVMLAFVEMLLQVVEFKEGEPKR